MRLAEHEIERHKEELIALIVADMQDPVTPILEAALVGEGLHDAGRMIPRLRKIFDHSAAVELDPASDIGQQVRRLHRDLRWRRGQHSNLRPGRGLPVVPKGGAFQVNLR